MAAINPIRYRGYYYDAELGMYYLQSRYYDPAVKRFINSDGSISTGQGFVGYNMFAYCLSNPVRYLDVQGRLAAEAAVATTNFWNPIGWIAASLVVVEAVILITAVVSVTYDTNQSSTSQTAHYSKAETSDKQKSTPQVQEKSISTPSSPTPPNNGRDPKYRAKSYHISKDIRVDGEGYGNGNGNVYVHTKYGKYYYNFNRKVFVDEYGRVARSAVQKLLNNKKIISAVYKAAQYIWG